jgi:protein gp37
MTENSKIEWTDHTFNPWIGCTKISAGCANCYAEALMDKRFNRVQWGDNGMREKTSEANWKTLQKWDRKLNGTGRRERVFIASLADVFEKHDSGIAHWRFDLWSIVENLQNLEVLLLTKRPENILDCTPYTWHNQAATDQTAHWARGPIVAQWPVHVWTGVSIENQETAHVRLSELARVPGKHFLSVEPILGPIDMGDISAIDWIIIGGESGPNARPLDLEWVEDILRQCETARVAIFVKQLGSHWARSTGAAHSKGGDPGEWPAGLQVRMFPEERRKSGQSKALKIIQETARHRPDLF